MNGPAAILSPYTLPLCELFHTLQKNLFGTSVKRILISHKSSQPLRRFALPIAVIGFALVKGMALLRRRLLLWHPEALEPSTV